MNKYKKQTNILNNKHKSILYIETGSKEEAEDNKKSYVVKSRIYDDVDTSFFRDQHFRWG